MQNQLLLLEDVEELGRSGDLVVVKPGYARNFLIPQKKAVVADKYTLRLRARLTEERAQKAIVDKKASEEIAEKYTSLDLSIEVKVDADGRMYGSVGATDIVKICAAQGLEIEKKSVVLAHPIKTVGVHNIQLKLKEGVIATIKLNVCGDKMPKKVVQVQAPEVSEEISSSE